MYEIRIFENPGKYSISGMTAIPLFCMKPSKRRTSAITASQINY